MSELPRHAISIRQPWAELILSGRKTVEMRLWSTDYRGPIWLHTGKHASTDLDRFFGFDELQRGAYLGLVDIAAVSSVDRERWRRWQSKHLDPGEYQPGVFGWTLENPVRIEAPIAAPGNLKVYAIDDPLFAKLSSAL